MQYLCLVLALVLSIWFKKDKGLPFVKTIYILILAGLIK